MGYVSNSTGVLKKVMMARPENVRLQPINVISDRWIARGGKIDAAACLREHAELVETYEENGVEVHFAPTRKDLTNQVFARDFGACVAEGYVLGRFREPIRFGETGVYEAELKKLGVPCAAKCRDGVFEGGDFWFLDNKTLAVGTVARTDAKGFASLEKQLKPLGYRMIRVPCPKDNLHLDMCFNIAAERVAVVCRDALPDFFLKMLKERKFELIDVAQEEVFQHHCNIQCIGAGRVVSFRSNREVNAKLRALGLTVLDVELHEILKMGGGPHCMTFPLLRDP
ncbi:MAG TPA: nitrate reductase [Ruminococcaceae bacterium]|jgi:N-dimethylarginine dimethylaminohydrolase|nr:nitrate reductase [Oscillospiraceae bacterium]HBG55443.1 nitrate reductase [Oscillospiraceae bacterium]HBQ45635.1 nitrate reductase [Oscillospiraceae bacterium]HBT90568.1 nitrate reductase [Oscillospiraceae bacterium]HCB91680.1 nitrate reductase [Oscillospiraceae bacterium]